MLLPIGLRAHNHAAASVWEWVDSVARVLKREELDVFFHGLWIIWEERNSIMWSAQAFNPHQVVSRGMQLLYDYQSLYPRGATGSGQRRRTSKWVKPPSGRLKINCDGAYNGEIGCGGFGVVVRNEVGGFVAAVSHSIPHLRSALHSEAEACRAGLRLATEKGWQQVEVECDSSILVAALNKNGSVPSEIWCIVQDCLALIQDLE